MPYDGRRDGEKPVLHRETLGSQIANRLRRGILLGNIEAHKRLTQDALCQLFDTSRIPVRDAIQQLLMEGFLEPSGTGVRVVALTAQDFDDVFAIEAELHSLACRLMIERSDERDLEGLETINSTMAQAIDRRDYEGAAAANQEFHRGINKLSKSSRLIAALRTFSARIDGDFLVRHPNYSSYALEEHYQILEAARAKDADTAVAVMRRHVFGTSEKLRHERLEFQRDAALS